jgi:hypothetical protein
MTERVVTLSPDCTRLVARAVTPYAPWATAAPWPAVHSFVERNNGRDPREGVERHYEKSLFSAAAAPYVLRTSDLTCPMQDDWGNLVFRSGSIGH